MAGRLLAGGAVSRSLASLDYDGDAVAGGVNLLDVQARRDQSEVMSGHKTVMIKGLFPLCAHRQPQILSAARKMRESL
jgi:hypothetical protein